MALQGLSLGALVAAVSAICSTTAFGQDLYSSVCAQTGTTCSVGRPGNISGIAQNGSWSSASVEQQAILGAYANVTSLQQSGSSNSATVSQSGSRNAVGIVQDGSNLTANVTQNGTNQTAIVAQQGSNHSTQITQSGYGASVIVQQFGSGMTMSIKQGK